MSMRNFWLNSLILVMIILLGTLGIPSLSIRQDKYSEDAAGVASSRINPSVTEPTVTEQKEIYIVVNTSFITVRSGPGSYYPLIGRLEQREQAKLIGRSTDGSWYIIDFKSQQGWIYNSLELINIDGDPDSLSIFESPATPTPLPTLFPPATPTRSPYADLVLVAAALDPLIPIPNQPFTLTVTIKNQGNANAGEFAVATSFEPGGVYSSQTVSELAAGQHTEVNLSATVAGTGIEEIIIVLDLNKGVNEGIGEGNNLPSFQYKVDRKIAAQGTLEVAPFENINFLGDEPDIYYTGTEFMAISETMLGILPNTDFEEIHFDFLMSEEKASSPSIQLNNYLDLKQDDIIWIQTAEGNLGALRIVNFEETNITLEYRIYSSE